MTGFVLVNRVLFDRREYRLRELERVLTDPSVSDRPLLERSPTVRRVLRRRTRRAVYRMIASAELPPTVAQACAAYALDRWGLSGMMDDASGMGPARRWRRVAAIIALGYIRAPALHALLGDALRDPDREVSAAAAITLHRLGDPEAAAHLIDALQHGVVPASRVATLLDQFGIPIADLLRPLLHAPATRARYWAASLLYRYPQTSWLPAEMIRMADDPEPSVRKVALMTLGNVGAVAAPVARCALEDPTSFVRATALRVLGRLGSLEGAADSGRAADVIAEMLGDQSWDVRTAAKEALVVLGPTVWRTVATRLISADAFARNGAAEVLQDLGTLDATLRMYADGTAPSVELTDTLARAYHEGGPALADAIRARVELGPPSSVESPEMSVTEESVS